ncbi:HPr family phosphocarrier protein, partial [Spirillospora sp. NPDC046719]
RRGVRAGRATVLVPAGAAHVVPVRIGRGGRSAPANSILAVLALGAGHGAEVTLEADDGPGADAALDALAALLARDLDAEEPAGA